MPAGVRKSEPRFELTGGALCLDFANTLGDRPRRREEHLGGYSDLLAFAEQTGALDRAARRRLESRAIRRGRRARAAFRRALALRETVYAIFSALAHGRDPSARDLGRLNAALERSLVRLRVAPGPRGFGWSWNEGDSFERVLWPMARSAAELLVSQEAGAIRECGGDTCSWLFVDRSRTRRRRWCDMSTCGNRQKARRHYQRIKAASRRSA